MKVTPTNLKGVVIVEPDVYGDHRGFFLESYQQQRYQETGIDVPFVQDNISFSLRHTLRGLHYQYPKCQAKLVQALQGKIYDVAVDIRRGSPTFGQWTAAVLTSENHRQLFIPEGFAHGYCVLSETAQCLYKCSEYYSPRDEGGIRWDDSQLEIEWPIDDPVLSERDQGLACLDAMDPDRLPVYAA